MFGDEIIESAEGVQQGDPLGPLLFALTIHTLVGSLQSPLNCWFLDDGTLGGDPETVLADFARVGTMGINLGLQLNIGKCEVAAHNFDIAEDSPLIRCRIIDFPDLMLLGAPLGCEAEVRCVEAMTDTLRRFSKRLKLIQPHQAFFLLKNSMSLPRLSYVLRTSNLIGQGGLLVYDDVLRSTLEDLLNVRLDDVQWHQATLPVKHGVVRDLGGV